MRSEIAKVAVKRRDQLILMGLAKRKPPTKGKKGKQAGDEAAAPAKTAPPHA